MSPELFRRLMAACAGAVEPLTPEGQAEHVAQLVKDLERPAPCEGRVAETTCDWKKGR